MRGAQEEEWQTVPDEWLSGGKDEDYGEKVQESSKKRNTGLQNDGGSESDLTELSSEEDDDEEEEEDVEEEIEEQPEPEPEETYQNPADFIEWETVYQLTFSSLRQALTALLDCDHST